MEPAKLPLFILRTLKLSQQRRQPQPTPRLPLKFCGGVDQLLLPFSLPFWYSEGSNSFVMIPFLTFLRLSRVFNIYSSHSI